MKAVWVNSDSITLRCITPTDAASRLLAEVRVSSGRTDDLVRIFFHVRYEATRDVAFSRLAFAQFGGETYNYNSEYASVVVGGGANASAPAAPPCTGGTSKVPSALYGGGGAFREPFPDNGGTNEGPWWISLGENTDAEVWPDDTFVVGDKGLVVRTYDAVLGGEVQTAPAYSLLCDKVGGAARPCDAAVLHKKWPPCFSRPRVTADIVCKVELGPPAGLSALQAGDYVDMRFEASSSGNGRACVAPRCF